MDTMFKGYLPPKYAPLTQVRRRFVGLMSIDT